MKTGSLKRFIIIVFLYGGQHFRIDTNEDAARDCLLQFRKFVLFKTVRGEDWEKACEERGGPPWVSYFGKKFRSIGPEDIIGGQTDPFQSIDWIVDFSHVSAMQIFSEEELNEDLQSTKKESAQ